MTMAAGDGSTDAENGVKMACRDRFHGGGGDDTASAAEGTGAGPASGPPRPGSGPEPEPGPEQQPEPGREDAGEQGRTGGLEIYGDSAYGSGEARAAYRDAGHDTIIKPGPTRPAVDGGFTLDDFTVDEEQGTVTCPAGQIRQMSKSRAVTFGAACAACPLREQCTTAKDGRSMTIHPHDGLLRAARAQAHTAGFRQAYPTPPGQPSSGLSPGPRPRTATGSGSATSAPPRTTPGCTTGAPRSTCAPCCGTG
jgi:Transposase DDE domain